MLLPLQTRRLTRGLTLIAFCFDKQVKSKAPDGTTAATAAATSKPRQIQPGAAIEADLDAGDGAAGWIAGVVTKAKPGRSSFRAAFRRPQDAEATVLWFKLADEGVDWRWPAEPVAAEPCTEASAKRRAPDKPSAGNGSSGKGRDDGRDKAGAPPPPPHAAVTRVLSKTQLQPSTLASPTPSVSFAIIYPALRPNRPAPHP